MGARPSVMCFFCSFCICYALTKVSRIGNAYFYSSRNPGAWFQLRPSNVVRIYFSKKLCRRYKIAPAATHNEFISPKPFEGDIKSPLHYPIESEGFVETILCRPPIAKKGWPSQSPVTIG
jgi:hypothetical protein